MSETPGDSEKAAILAEIHKAFGGVTRDGGMSWRESIAADEQLSASEAIALRDQDTESSWTELPDDPDWDLTMGTGGLSFLDPIAFRYYLPAAMVVAVETGDYEPLDFHLRLPKDFLRDYKLSQWSLFDESQRSCVRHFIEYMMRMYANGFDAVSEIGRKDWRRVYDSYWKDV